MLFYLFGGYGIEHSTAQHGTRLDPLFLGDLLGYPAVEDTHLSGMHGEGKRFPFNPFVSSEYLVDK